MVARFLILFSLRFSGRYAGGFPQRPGSREALGTVFFLTPRGLMSREERGVRGVHVEGTAAPKLLGVAMLGERHRRECSLLESQGLWLSWAKGSAFKKRAALFRSVQRTLQLNLKYFEFFFFQFFLSPSLLRTSYSRQTIYPRRRN